MKVQNMTGKNGRAIPNQFILTSSDNKYDYEEFQSYDSLIVSKHTRKDSGSVYVFLDKKYWDYSVTTGKYRNQFLQETKKETQAKIDSGEYILTDLN